MGRKSSQMVTKSEQVAFIRNKLMTGNEQIKMQKIVLNQLPKGTWLKKSFQISFQAFKAISDIP